MKKFLLLVSGPQGSGKSTQAELIADRFSAPIFEAGTELRAVVERGEPGAAEIEAYMKRGDLVPHHYVDDLFKEFFVRYQDSAVLVSDGYPRNLPELAIAEKICDNTNRTIIGINVDLAEKTAIERIISRAKNAESEHRPDNSPAAIRERLRLYREETLPVLEQIKAKHRLLVIDGQPPIETVTATTQSALQPLLAE